VALAMVVAAADARPPARMLVYAKEWSLWPSRTSLPAGRVTVQLYNRGEDAHDLRIRRRGHTVGAVAVTQSGELGQATWRLGPGIYELYCSLSGHRAKGMHVTLRVY
jgi:plastocyanin